MITKGYVLDPVAYEQADTISRNTSDMYKALFTRLENVIQSEKNVEIHINNMNDYLSALQTYGLREDVNHYDLLRVPVEVTYDDRGNPLNEGEPLFVIDANAREISVPNQYKQNGLTVKGDQLAEIVWFRINRFYDLMDFSLFDNPRQGDSSEHSGQHCYIEWYNPAAKEEEYQSGVDYAYGMTWDEDYVYFGWPIGHKVSGEAGTLQFSVRFLSINANHEVDYNYATKIATCEIKTTLNFNMTDGSIVAESWEDLLYSRPMYSGVVNSVDSPAAIILLPLEGGEQDLGNDGYFKLPVVATTSAATSANQTLSFVWYKDGSPIPDSALTKQGEEATAQQINAVKQGVSGDAIVDYDTDDEHARESVYYADSTGRYSLMVGNQMAGRSSIRYIYAGDTVIIPDPTNIYLDEDELISKAYANYGSITGTILKVKVRDRDSVNGKISFKWHRIYDGVDTVVDTQTPAAGEDSVSTYAPTAEGLYYCIAYNTKNKDVTNSFQETVTRTADVRIEPQGIILNSQYNNYTHVLQANATQADHHKFHKIRYRLQWTSPDYNTTQILKDVTTADQFVFECLEAGFYQLTAVEVVFDDDPTMIREGGTGETAVAQTITLNANLERVDTSSDSGSTFEHAVSGQNAPATPSASEAGGGN